MTAQKKFYFFSFIYVFFIAFEYAIVRPASNALFLEAFSSKAIPYLWLATIPVNLLITFFYNRALPRLGCLKTFLWITLTALFLNTISAFWITESPVLCFLQNIYKDLYILFMYKQIWSLIHTTITNRNAKKFSLFFIMGGIGAIFGGIISGFFATTLTSKGLLFCTLPIYIIVIWAYSQALKLSAPYQPSTAKGGFSLISKSPLLTLILLILVFMQMSIAIVEYQFNTSLEALIPLTDLRTQYLGRLLTIVNLLTIFIQLLGGVLIDRFFGLKKSHMFIPGLLLCNSVLYFIYPSFTLVSCLFVAIKTMDFSFFSTCREMLFFPLSSDEKFRAKAVIDVFAYRSAKGISSLFLLFIPTVSYLSFFSFAVFLIWIAVIYLLFKRYYALN